MLRVLEAYHQQLSESLLDRLRDLLKFLNFDRLTVPYVARKPLVSLALAVPDLGATPLVDEGEKFEEEYAEVVALVGGAAVNAGHDALQNLGERLQDVEVGHSVRLQHPQKLERIQRIACREHQSRVHAVLDEIGAQSDDGLHVSFGHLEATRQPFLQELLHPRRALLALLVLLLKALLLLLELLVVALTLALLAPRFVYLSLQLPHLVLVDIVGDHQLLEIHVPEDRV